MSRLRPVSSIEHEVDDYLAQMAEAFETVIQQAFEHQFEVWLEQYGHVKCPTCVASMSAGKSSMRDASSVTAADSLEETSNDGVCEQASALMQTLANSVVADEQTLRFPRVKVRKKDSNILVQGGEGFRDGRA